MSNAKQLVDQLDEWYEEYEWFDEYRYHKLMEFIDENKRKEDD